MVKGRYGALPFHFLTVPCLRGVPFTSLCSNPPCSARTLVSSNPPPPFAPVSPGLSLCGSLSYSLPPILSCSPLLILSCCASLILSHRVLPSLSLTLCLFPSLPRPKRGFGLFGASLSPPGFEPSSTGQKRCGVSTGPRRWVICTMAPWHHGTMRFTLLLLVVTPCHAYLLSHGGVFSSV